MTISNAKQRKLDLLAKKQRERLRAHFFARKLWVGERFKPDTEREKFYTHLSDAMGAARAGDTIIICGQARDEFHYHDRWPPEAEKHSYAGLSD